MADGWGTRADRALAAALAVETAQETPYTWALLARTVAYRHGWNDPRVANYLSKVRAARLSPGRWGLGYPYDAFQDGTVNPAGTSHLITNVDHVGPLLLDAYKAGKADRGELEDILKVAVGWPRTYDGPEGWCYAYSDHPNDRTVDKSVHNVNQAAGRFFRQCTDAGVSVSGMLLARIQISRYETARYLVAGYNWRYIERPGYRLGGADYQAVGTEWAMLEVPAIGRAAVNYSLGHDWAPDHMSALAHASLAPYGCAAARRWLPEVDRFIADPPPGQSPANRLAQIAVCTARAAHVCGD